MGKVDIRMQKQLTFWIWFREICIFLLFWPIFPVFLWGKIIGGDGYATDNGFAIVFFWLYLILGWYLAYRIFCERTKNYIFPKKDNPYSLLKEIGLFILIWPIIPILSLLIDQLISSAFQTTFPTLDIFVTGLMLLGWLLALILFLFRRKSYLGTIFKNKNLESKN